MKKETQMVEKEDKSEVGQLIQKAIESKVPIEVMERLFVLQKEYKSDKAREAFVKAKSKFQGEVPIITSDKTVKNKDGQTVRYTYTSLGHIAEQIKKTLTENELSYSWDVVHENNHMKVVATLTHSMGHSETSTFEIPISQDQYMTEPQKYASAQTYAKRYTLINVLGITTADEDLDATDANGEKEAKSSKSKIMFLLKSLGRKTQTKEEVELGVLEVTKLKLEEKNYEEIAKRLQVALKEESENEETTIQQ